MRPSALTLSKPNAIAYLYLILMVITFGLASSNDQVVYLRHDKTTGHLTMHPGQKIVITTTDISSKQERFQRLIVSASSNFDLTFYNEATRRFLCFKLNKKHWKLVGLKNPRNCAMCRFKEKIENGFHTYYIEKGGEKHFLAFKKNGTFSEHKINVKFMKLLAKGSANETTVRPRRHHAGDPHKCVDARKRRHGRQRMGR